MRKDKMNRDYRFDIARAAAMTYVVAFVHLFGYVYNAKSAAHDCIQGCDVLTASCLALFTFVSGYLLGKKYIFGGVEEGSVWQFYKKRLLRIIPLFLLSAFVLWIIGFNNTRATIQCVLCISPFLRPRPWTLWYIPVILICYLITPIVSRKNFLWRLISASVIIIIILALGYVFPDIDWRFQYYSFFYLVGLVSAPYSDWKFEKASILKWIIAVLYIGLLVIAHYFSLNVILKRLFSGIGVFALLFMCEGLAKMVFRKDNVISKMVVDVSYASMACYLFHRFFFWLAELLLNPTSHGLKWLYMVGFVFPIIIVLSYYIQFGYDKLINSLSSRL